MRWIATLGSILLVVMSITRLGCDSASGQTADDAARRFVGMWRLVSITTSGQVNPDRGPHPTGFIVYDRSGNMAVQIMPDRNRPKYAGAQPTPEEAKAALIGYTAYFGTYAVDVHRNALSQRQYQPGRYH
jgi:Lipocalin-like domain